MATARADHMELNNTPCVCLCCFLLLLVGIALAFSSMVMLVLGVICLADPHGWCPDKSGNIVMVVIGGAGVLGGIMARMRAAPSA